MAFPGVGRPPALFFLWILPKNIFSRICGWIAEVQFPQFILSPLIDFFCRIYEIDLSEAEKPPKGFASFNAFFTRKLRPGLRSISEKKDGVLSPVDGKLGEFGKIEEGRIIQSKGLDYQLEELLEDSERVSYYNGGFFLNIYLAPHNYHRIHSMVDGMVRDFTYIPGDLWTVSPLGVKYVTRLFARNERLVTYFDTLYGECAIVKVGATVVGRIRVKYHNQTTNCRGASCNFVHLEQPWKVKRGEEIGLFELGSSVIILFAKGQVKMDSFQKGQEVKFGESLGSFINKK